MSNEIKELSVSTFPLFPSPSCACVLMRRYMSHLPLHVVLMSEVESSASQYLRLRHGTLDLLSPVSSSWIVKKGKEIAEVKKKRGIEGKGGGVFGFPRYLLLKPSAFVFLFVSRPQRFRAFAPLQSKLWAVCLAQLEGSLTASSWGVGREPSYCSWEDGSRFSIWVISAAKRAPSMVFLAADAAGRRWEHSKLY